MRLSRVVIICMLLLGGLSSCLRADSGNKVTAEDLLAAALTSSDISITSADKTEWWPALPQFYDEHFKGSESEMFYIVQSYSYAKPFDSRTIENALTFYKDDSGAADSFKTAQETLDKKSTTCAGPAVGDECRYFTRTSDSGAKESAVRFRVGCVMARITATSKDDLVGQDRLAAYAKPVVRRLKWLQQGMLKSRPIRNASLLPLESATSAIGQISGTAVVPVEGWALVDTAGDPALVKAELYKSGVTEMLLRRYVLNADPKQVVEAIVFEFPDADPAAAWGQWMKNDVKASERLDTGKTGPQSVFSFKSRISLYELTFAKGRYVVDVSAWSPFDQTTKACETGARKLAELFYSSLPNNL